jgi:hypothetical protein
MLHAPATRDRARRAARTKRTRAQYETSFGQTGMCSLPLQPMIEQLSSFTGRRRRPATGKRSNEATAVGRGPWSVV